MNDLIYVHVCIYIWMYDGVIDMGYMCWYDLAVRLCHQEGCMWSDPSGWTRCTCVQELFRVSGLIERDSVWIILTITAVNSHCYLVHDWMDGWLSVVKHSVFMLVVDMLLCCTDPTVTVCCLSHHIWVSIDLFYSYTAVSWRSLLMHPLKEQRLDR
jgi:hypothetical protein